ncbi:hypothetical protein SAMN04487897_13122 [Paenibacillus sp. yr247]|uniref:hypothetical protein n=1 Tax=Paenibacillus sp. yr247 TaxID=1761880 RepID=UPI00088EC3E4|nr:hypothetical protein [Paenibacillus sp. yr247]SDP02208.1 hypothetical protein SAMN04487897_13122 [Paenibacillus sp. yr247]
MRMIKYLIIAWLVLLLAVLVIPRLVNHNKLGNPIPQANTEKNAERKKQFPQNHEEIDAVKDTIAHFLDSINNGDIETAVSYIEPNYTFTLFAEKKGTARDVVLKQYVTLFEPKQLVSVNGITITSNRTGYSCKVNVTLSGKSDEVFSIIAIPMTNDEGIGKVWYFKDITRE